MNKIYMALIFLTLFLCPDSAYAQENMSFAGIFSKKPLVECPNPGTVFQGERDGSINLPGGSYTSYTSQGIPTELIVPSATGKGFVRIPIKNDFNPSASYLDAQELRLKVREMTSQLLETWSFSGIKDMVAYITTFTPQHDLTLPTAFGQTLREAFIYEFNNRGFPVRDFSARDLIINEGGYAFGVSNGTYKTPVIAKNAAIITGSFYKDKEYLFMNVRLVRGYDGMVLRTAQTIFPVTPLVERMMESNYHPKSFPSLPLSSGGLPIVSGIIIK